MHRRLFALVTAGILAAPLAAAVPLAAQAAPSRTGLTARNVPVCPTPQNTLAARCLAVRHEQVDRNGKPVSPNASTLKGYTPTDLQGAYNLVSASLNYGAGQTIAIVDAYNNPNAASDLVMYRLNMGLPSIATSNCSLSSTSPCFLKVNQNGATDSYPQDDGGWAQEISLDLDMASAICPKCNILLVEANSAYFSDLGTAVNTAATLWAVAISNSYGTSGDVSDASYGTYYNQPGIAVTASTGDSGYGVGYPASSAYTVAVGGTTLSADSNPSNLRGWSESAWSGAGSGCSKYQALPDWQTSTVANAACGSKRAIADVSADADPNTGVQVYDSYSYGGLSGWLQFGGTSVSSPIIASVYALAKSAGATWSGNPASVLYAHSSALYDATGGSNGRCHPSVLCNGGTGWDGPTGLGTPNGLAAFGGPGGGSTTTTPTAAFTSNCPDLTCTFTDASTDSGGNITGWSWNFGDGSTSTAQDPIHPYTSDNTYTVTLTVTDSGSQTTSFVSHSVTVSTSSGTAPSITGKSCSGAKCTFTATGSDPLTWSFGLTSTSGIPVSWTYTSPGNYTVTVTDVYGATSAPASVSCGWNGNGRTKALSCS